MVRPKRSGQRTNIAAGSLPSLPARFGWLPSYMTARGMSLASGAGNLPLACRRATASHSRSWYPASPAKLSRPILRWRPGHNTKGLAPYAGLSGLSPFCLCMERINPITSTPTTAPRLQQVNRSVSVNDSGGPPVADPVGVGVTWAGGEALAAACALPAATAPNTRTATTTNTVRPETTAFLCSTATSCVLR